MYNLYSSVDLATDIEFIEASVAVNAYREQNDFLLTKLKGLYSEALGGFIGYMFSLLIKNIGLFLAKLLIVLKKVLIVIFSSVVVAIARRIAQGRSTSTVGGGSGGNSNIGVPTITIDGLKKAVDSTVNKQDVEKLRSYVKSGITPLSVSGINFADITEGDTRNIAIVVKDFIDAHRGEFIGKETTMRNNVDPINPLTFVMEEPALMDLIIESLNSEIEANGPAVKAINKELKGREFTFLKEKGYTALESAMRLMGVQNPDTTSIADTLVNIMSVALEAFAVCEINVQETLSLITDGKKPSIIENVNEYCGRLKPLISEIDKYKAFERIKKDMLQMESSGNYTDSKMLDIIYKDQKVLFEKIKFPLDLSKCKTMNEAITKVSNVAAHLGTASSEFHKCKSINDVKLSMVDLTNSSRHTVVRVKLLPKVNSDNYKDGEEMAYKMMYSFMNSKEAKANNPSIIDSKARALSDSIKSINDTIQNVDFNLSTDNTFSGRIQEACTFTNHISSILSSTTHLIGSLGMYKVTGTSATIQDMITERANVLQAIYIQYMIENNK